MQKLKKKVIMYFSVLILQLRLSFPAKNISFRNIY